MNIPRIETILDLNGRQEKTSEYPGQIDQSLNADLYEGIGAQAVDFVAICVHSTAMGLVYVNDGLIRESKLYSFYDRHEPSFYDRHEPTTEILRESWPEMESYFERVEFVLAFGIGIHRSNLKKALRLIRVKLPEKKYVCLYNWTQRNLTPGGLESVCNKLEIEYEIRPDSYQQFPRYYASYVHQATLVAEIAVTLQQDYGMQLEKSIVKPPIPWN